MSTERKKVGKGTMSVTAKKTDKEKWGGKRIRTMSFR